MKKWWNTIPWRMIQTNLREKDWENLDPKTFVDSLVDVRCTVLLLNSCGIIANYDTDIQDTVRNPYAKSDTMKQILDLCHQNGIRVIARTDFSKVRYEIYEKHPDWAVRTQEGEIINYNGNVHVCPNSDYYQKVKDDMLKELFSRYDFDGLFCNMGGFLSVDYSYNYYGPCYCDKCRQKYKAAFHEDMPATTRALNPALMKVMSFENGCSKANKKNLVELVRGINENIAINGVDFIREEANTDIGVGQWPYSSSSNGRLAYNPERGRVADNACVDFIGFRYRHSSVSDHQIAMRLYQSMANSGSLSYYVIGDLLNHGDRSALKTVKNIYQFHQDHEDLYMHMSKCADTLLIRSKALSREDEEGCGLVRILSELHIPFDEVNLNELDENALKGKKWVITGELRRIDPNTKTLLDNFVDQGGILIATGDTNDLQCLGIQEKIEKRQKLNSSVLETDDDFKYAALNHYLPFGSEFNLYHYEESVKQHGNLVEEHPFGPPELCSIGLVIEKCGIAENNYGSGKAILLPCKAASFYYKEGYVNTLNLFKDIFFNFAEMKPLSNCSEQVEFALMKSEEKIVLSLINTSGYHGNSFFAPIEMNNIEINYDIKGMKTTCLCGGKIKETEQGFVLDKLNEFEVIVIEKGEN